LARYENVAMAVILVDSQIDDNLLNELKNLKEANSVSYAQI
jgi:hypothetical protein